MAVLKLTTFPDKLLKQKTREVFRITDEDRRLVEDMIETMYAEHGVGLAANQVGVSKRIFVASADQVRGKELVFFNPRIVRREGAVKEFEGCLSVPECFEPVRRAKCVWLQGMDLNGESVEFKAEGLLARIFQHETDHLNGFLFIDRLGFIKSKLTRKALLKRKTAR
jgi:peptide deformylase